MISYNMQKIQPVTMFNEGFHGYFSKSSVLPDVLAGPQNDYLMIKDILVVVFFFFSLSIKHLE